MDVHKKDLVYVGITLEFLLNSAKLDMRKNGLENGIATPRRNYPVSIAERTVNVSTVLPLQYLQCTVIIVDNFATCRIVLVPFKLI